MGFASPSSSKIVVSKGKPKKAAVAIEGLAELAALEVLQSTLAGMISRATDKVHDNMMDHFKKVGMEAKARPANFKGEEEGTGFVATGDFQLRKRASRSPLNDQEVAILKLANIDIEEVTTEEARLYINPDYASNQDLLSRIDAVLTVAKEEGKLDDYPDNFVLSSDAKTAMFATEASIDQVFKLKAEEIDALLPLVCVPSKGRYSVTDTDSALKSVRKNALLEMFGYEEVASAELEIA